MLTVLASTLAFLTPGAPHAGRPVAGVASPRAAVLPRMDAMVTASTVPLTGQTLAAALKMRTDLTGAAYAIYWTKVKDELKVAGSRVATPAAKAFVDGSMNVVLDATGDGPIAVVKRTGDSLFVPNVEASNLKRRELAFKTGVGQVVFTPFEDGVLEFGNLADSPQWEDVPRAPLMPKAPLRKAFEDLGALYALFWKLDGDKFTVAADYENPRDVSKRQMLRGDDESFVKISRRIELDTTGDGPVAKSMQSGEEGVVFFGDGVTSTDASAMKREGAAREYGVTSIHFVPVIDAKGNKEGVLEYGVSGSTKLNEITLQATLKMQADIAGAGYSIYWSQEGSKAVAARTYSSDEYRGALAGAGKQFSFAEASQATSFELSGESPVAQVMRTHNSVFIQDASKAEDDPRAFTTESYLIDSVAYIPVLGGVIEIGAFNGGRKWNEPKDALLQVVPNEEVEAAIGAGATYMILWQRNEAKGVYEAATEYELPKNALNKAAQAKGIMAKYDGGTGSLTLPAFSNLVSELITFQGGKPLPAKDIKAAFERFDADGSGDIDVSELNEALRGLGIETGDGSSYIADSAKLMLSIGGDGPVGVCGDSMSTIVVPNTQTYPSFKRADLAKEWGVGKLTCVPLETGVLEFGTVTKDKRETTIGSEYQEATRAYRRTVYMHQEWVDHRSTERFFRSLTTILESGVLRARNKEVNLILGFASFLVVWNSIAGGYTDFEMVKHGAIIPHLPVLSVPLSFFTLTSPTLGLLLVFRTNAAYARWDNARKVWGDIINKCRSIVRQANCFFTDDRYPGYGNYRDYRRRVAAETSAFTRCLRCFLRGKEDEDNLRVELKELGFTPSEVAGYLGAANKQVYALQKISETMREYGMDSRDRAQMDATLTALCDDVGACERIFKTPIPLVYTRHTSRFVGSWLTLLPLALYGVDTSWNHLICIPASALILFFLLGIEELGLQIEEPFGILPMEAFIGGAITAPNNDMILVEDKRRAMEAQIKGSRAMPAAASVAIPAAAAAAVTPAKSESLSQELELVKMQAAKAEAEARAANEARMLAEAQAARAEAEAREAEAKAATSVKGVVAPAPSAPAEAVAAAPAAFVPPKKWTP